MSAVEEEMEFAVGWASLAEDDSGRVAAYGRAQQNPAFQTLLNEGERLMRLLAAYTVPPPAEAVLRRIEALLVAEMNSERVRSSYGSTAKVAVARPSQGWLGQGWLVLAIPLSVALGWLAVLLLSSKPVLSSPRLVGSLAMAIVATSAALGVFRWRALVALGVSALGLGAALIAGENGGLGPASAAAHCLASSLAAAALPLATATVLTLKGKLRLQSGNWVFAGIGAAGALAGAAALEITCATRVMGHLLAFHAGGILLAALLGWSLASLPALRPWVSPRA